MRLNYISFLLLLLLICSCSPNIDVNPVDINDSFISGTWKTEFKIQDANKTDELKLTLALIGKLANIGTFNGSGDATYSGAQGTTNFSYTIKDNVTGTYSINEIKVTMISSISGNKYEFTGTKDNSASVTTYKGPVTITINGKATVFTNCSLFKSAS